VWRSPQSLDVPPIFGDSGLRYLAGQMGNIVKPPENISDKPEIQILHRSPKQARLPESDSAVGTTRPRDGGQHVSQTLLAVVAAEIHFGAVESLHDMRH